MTDGDEDNSSKRVRFAKKVVTGHHYVDDSFLGDYVRNYQDASAQYQDMRQNLERQPKKNLVDTHAMRTDDPVGAKTCDVRPLRNIDF